MLKTKITEFGLMGMIIDRHYFVDVIKKSRQGGNRKLQSRPNSESSNHSNKP